ncbi:MAG: sigma-70 family RNA polymerase sigma factor [Chloroflexi bacterium]|nr:sigma-70 family RNA polymerase sigma factor [Chloroflexota bacterium]
MPSVDERRLLERAQTNAAGVAELFDAYFYRIYAYAYRRVGSRETAEDIAATVFEDAMNGIKRVRWLGKPIIAWLYRIAARRVADYYRAHRVTESLDDRLELVGEAMSDAERVERDDEYRSVRCGIERLTERDREIIRLAFFDELGGAEMAAMLGCTTNNVYVRLHRAMKNLKAILEKERQGVV